MEEQNKAQHKKFQEWLNECPVSILEYEDWVDTVRVEFLIPLSDKEKE
tara:strand:- start:536 stop:679 length:144 start_codon:yes stop_codon:yes gene_type:complete